MRVSVHWLSNSPGGARVKLASSFLISTSALLLSACAEPPAHHIASRSTVMTLGANANLGKGDFSSYANLADFKGRRHLYAVGPVQHMGGEVLVIDSVPYAAEVRDGNILVSSSWDYQPPFLAYAGVPRWREIAIPIDVKTFVELENYLGTLASQYGFAEDQAFPFRLRATPAHLSFLIMNRPQAPTDGKPLRSYRTTWELTDEPAEFIGFYSTRHKGVFLSEDERVHMHFITNDRAKAGHVESFELKPGGRLFLPR